MKNTTLRRHRISYSQIKAPQLIESRLRYVYEQTKIRNVRIQPHL